MREKILFCSVFLVSFVFAQSNAESKLIQIEERLDSLGEYAGSTVIGKDASPVAVSGDFTVRLKHFDYIERSPLQDNKKMQTFINSALNASIVVSPASYLTVFSNLYLPFDFGGFFANSQAFTPSTTDLGYSTGERVQGFHPSSDLYGASVNESMTAGLDMRGGSFGAALIMGGVLWTSQSPLSIWERETNPRFISQYELYEEEKVVSTYYKEKGFKPVKEGGRAFWTNRSFGGWLLDVHTLPYNFKGQFLYSQPASVDIGYRDGLRLNSRDDGEMELVGTYDYRGTVMAGRLAKEKIDFGNASLIAGLNYMGIDFDPALIYERGFKDIFFDQNEKAIKFENTRVATLDLKGNLTPQFFLSFDLAFSWNDTLVFNSATSDECNKYHYEACYNAKEYESKSSSPTFGVYVKAQDKHWLPLTLELIYLPKDFYSPYSMSNPDRWPAWRKDQFYVGAGTFRYGPNMTGANIKIEPEFNRGRFDLQYGIHKQVEAGTDIVNFKYNLIGRQLWETSISWTRHKPFFLLDSGNTGFTKPNGGYHYIARLSGSPISPGFKLGDTKGGLRSGYGETWDAFVPYANAQDAFYCNQINFYKGDDAGKMQCNMPTSVKWNSSISADMGYDIGHWFGTDRNIMLQLYTALSGVSTSFIPVAYTDKYSDNVLMWNWFVQSEPAIALFPTLHAVLVLGFENFRAQQAYVNLEDVAVDSKSVYGGLYPYSIYNYKLSPINILHTALGFGFDWDFAARAGLHFRYKYLTNNDENLPQNNWKVHHVQAETKVWF